MDAAAVSRFDLSAWSTFQIVLFLDRMLDLSPLPHGTAPCWCDGCQGDRCGRLSSRVRVPVCPSDVMSALSRCYSSLFDGLNAEVQIRWLQMVVRNSFYPELPRVRAFLHKHVSPNIRPHVWLRHPARSLLLHPGHVTSGVFVCLHTSTMMTPQQEEQVT